MVIDMLDLLSGVRPQRPRPVPASTAPGRGELVKQGKEPVTSRPMGGRCAIQRWVIILRSRGRRSAGRLSGTDSVISPSAEPRSRLPPLAPGPC